MTGRNARPRLQLRRRPRRLARGVPVLRAVALQHQQSQLRRRPGSTPPSPMPRRRATTSSWPGTSRTGRPPPVSTVPRTARQAVARPARQVQRPAPAETATSTATPGSTRSSNRHPRRRHRYPGVHRRHRRHRLLPLAEHCREPGHPAGQHLGLAQADLARRWPLQMAVRPHLGRHLHRRRITLTDTGSRAARPLKCPRRPRAMIRTWCATSVGGAMSS